MAGIRRECEGWSARFVSGTIEAIKGHGNKAAERRLRVGYVSPDFRAHVLAQIGMPLFEHHDHGAFEIFFYSAVETEDGVTDRFKACADVWRPVVGLGPRELAEQIQKDGIDVLVDLSMHMAETRLAAFAYKPGAGSDHVVCIPGHDGAWDHRLPVERSVHRSAGARCVLHGADDSPAGFVLVLRSDLRRAGAARVAGRGG